MQKTEEENLKTLGERGREAQAEAEEKTTRKKEFESRREERRRTRIAEVSMTWLGEYWPDEVFDWVSWLVLLFAIPWILPVPLKYKIWMDVALLGSFFILMMVARVWGVFRFQKELAWLAALPFPVHGYVESLGDLGGRISAPNVTGKSAGVAFFVRFISPSSMPVKDIFHGFDPRLEVSEKEGEWKLVKADFLGGASNYPLHVYFHKLVEQVLKPLSMQQPIGDVRVRLDTFQNKIDDDRRHMAEIFQHDREVREERRAKDGDGRAT